MSQKQVVVAASIIAVAAAGLLLLSSKPKEPKETRVARWKKKLHNHPVTATAIVGDSVVIGIGGLVTGIMGIVQFYHWIAS